MWVVLQPHQFRARSQPSSADSSAHSRAGFTIVELLIVIVVIGILAGLVIVAYNGIRARAEDASLQSEASQAGKKVLAYKALNSDGLPADLTAAGVSPGSGHDQYYRVTPDGKDFCLAVNITGSPARVYSVTSTNGAAKQGTCQGYILVPGNSVLGTNDFWVMKYEPKNVSGIATSQAASTPWVNISQTDAISISSATCDGCHLISEAEWMTLAGNLLGVSSNWSSGTVGSGYIYSGHNDGAPGNSLAASTNDSDGYNGTGQSGTSSQRRALILSNGEVIWDFAGNVWEWTTGSIVSGQQPGISGESAFTYKEWNDGSLLWNGLPTVSRPITLASQPGLSSINSWTSSHGTGQLYSNYGDAITRGFIRGGAWAHGIAAGLLALFLNNAPSGAYADLGFRVSR